MKKRVILDRAYAFFLLGYIARMERPGHNLSVSDANQETVIGTAMSVLNHALLLFDNVLIEDYYGSSLRHLTKDKTWFWDMFQVYSPDKVSSADPEFNSCVEDSVELDLRDTSFRQLVRSHFEPRYMQKENLSSLAWNINRTLQTARCLDAAILPWPSKMHLYRHKFARVAHFHPEEKPYSVLKTVLEFQVPGFAVNDLRDLVYLRKDPRARSFKELVWRLSDSSHAGDRESILQQLEDEKAKLVSGLAPKTSAFVRTVVSTPMPFPFNVALEALLTLAKLRTFKCYSWYFYLIDLRQKWASNVDTQ